MIFDLGDVPLTVGGGSPLYTIEAEHVAAAVAFVLVALGLWRYRARIAMRAPVDQLLVALLAATTAIHLGLAVGHPGGALPLLFAVDAVGLGCVTVRVARGGHAGKLGALLLVGSIGAYWGAMVIGEPPDQMGMFTKLIEIAALAVIFRPGPSRPRARLRGLAGSSAVVALVFVTALSGWLGAFRAAQPEREAVASHEHGAVAPPGTVMPPVPQRPPTPAESAAAAALLDATRVSIARYADPAVAAADGYIVQGMSGVDFHADNPAYEHDGRILDPARPESLVYGVAPDGRPVLLGALFKMPNIGDSGPMVGGPLTVWHAHENICFSLLPPSLTGVLSPFGTCPIGSFDLPLTSQMIHVWIVPGAPTPIGDLDTEWRKAYLASTALAPTRPLAR